MRLLLAAIVLFCGSSPVFAHRLHVDPKIVGEQLRVEAFYDDDTPAQEAHITVLIGDEVVAQGRADEKGVWSCQRPKPGTYVVKAESVGHAAKETLVIGASAEPLDETFNDARNQQTQTPWGRLAGGLGLIGGLYVAWLVARRAMGKVSRSN